MTRHRTRPPGAALVTAALVSLLAAVANAQDQLWLVQFGSARSDLTTPLAPDGAGGVYIAGYTLGDLGGGGGGGGGGAGSGDAFLIRADRRGTPIWMRQFGTAEFDFAVTVVSDGEDGAFVAGYTSGDLAGPHAGGTDAFLSRYDGRGNQLWIRQFGTPVDDTIDSVVASANGGVYVAGLTFGDLAGKSEGRRDAYIAHYTGAGERTWIKQFGTAKADYANALAPDGSGGLFVAGRTYGSLGGPNAGGMDVFLARYDSAGERTWITQFGSIATESLYALAPDERGGVYLTGWTDGAIGGTNQGRFDAFLARHDAQGNQIWITQYGSSEDEYPWAIAPDGRGGVYVGGYTRGGLAGPNANPQGIGFDAFLVHYESTGVQTMARQLGTPENDRCYGLATDGSGGVFFGGRTQGDLGGPNAGGYDVFLARFGDAACYRADCDQGTGVGVLDIFDFLCFQTAFMDGEEFACDCDTSTGTAVCDIFDFLCFQNAFVSGCP